MITISAVILAGGLARRMQGAEKGLQLLGDKSLVARIIQRLQPQLNGALLAINANRNQEQYAQFGLPVFSDEIPNFQGPLSGMLTALKRAQSDYVLFVPCDCPFLPLDLLAKLKSAVQNSHSFVAYAHDGEREHPTFCLLSRQLIEPLSDYLAQGERRLLQFFRQQQGIAVDFSSQKHAFQNFNSLQDLAEYEQTL